MDLRLTDGFGGARTRRGKRGELEQINFEAFGLANPALCSPLIEGLQQGRPWNEPQASPQNPWLQAPSPNPVSIPTHPLPTPHPPPCLAFGVWGLQLSLGTYLTFPPPPSPPPERVVVQCF